MTGEPTHAALKQRITPEVMFSTKRAPQISITDSKVKYHYTSLSAMFSPLHSAACEEY